MKTRKQLYHGPSRRTANAVIDAYNARSPDGLIAELHVEADDRYLTVLVCDYRLLCEWCNDRPIFGGADLCWHCWDDREVRKADAKREAEGEAKP